MPRLVPPVDLRRTASREDARALEELCGITFALADLPSLLDPRGLRFQRLEWLGDAILDALLAQHRRSRPSCCAGGPLEQLCSDEALARRAVDAGLSAALDWEPSPGRQADLVEALIGAAWLAAPRDALRVAEVLVHRGLTLDAVAEATDGGCAGLRDDAALGSAVLEAAASTSLLVSQPSADEGQLSTVRQRQLSAASLVVRGRGLLEGCFGPREHLLDHVQAGIGRVSASQGLLAGIELASAVVVDP